jgi:adenylosuccinate synthase
MLKQAVALNGLTSLALTKLDVLSGMGPVRVAVAYRHGGHRLTEVPARVEQLADCEPEYVELPGWELPEGGLTREAELPITAREYVAFVENALGIPVSILSLGPEREQIVFRSDPFLHFSA